jgi:hypothetical protein
MKFVMSDSPTCLQRSSDQRGLSCLPSWASEIGINSKAPLPCTLEPIDAQEIHTQCHSSLGVPDAGALMQHGDARRLQLGDDGTRRVASRLDDVHALVHDDLRVRVVVRRHEGWQQGDVDAKRPGRKLSTPADFLSQALGLGEDQGRDDAQAARIRDSAGQLRITNMLR